MRWHVMGIAVIAASVLAHGPVTVQPSVHKSDSSPAMPSVDSELRQRLEKLTPDRPEDYFLLAEDVSDGADDEPRIQLARTLFVLAFELDRKKGGGTALAASCALGLAKVERLDRDKRWLIAIATAVDRRYALPDWNVSAAPLISDETAYKAATVLGLARSGEGREARRIWDQPGVADVLRRYERAIGNTGQTGALSRLDKAVQQWPCPECGNARAVNKPGERGGVEVRLCPTCRGNPGPKLTEDEYFSQLRFEALLLEGIQRSWAAQVVVDQGAPLRDPDLDEVAPTFGVEVGKPYWREGRWISTP